MAIIAPFGYLLAAVLFVVLAILVATGWQRRLQSGLLLLASVVSAVWAGLQLVQTATGNLPVEVLFASEVFRDAAWLAFLVSVLQRARGDVLSPALRLAALVVPVAVLVLGLLPLGLASGSQSVFVLGSIVLAIIGLALTERIYRASDPAVRGPIVYLCVAMAGIFGYDLVLFSSAVLVGQIEPGMWAARGLANAFIAPFLAVAARRNRDWPVDMFVSRQVAYASVTFFGAGIYLLLMAVGGYYVKEFGGDWGTAAAAILFFGAVIFLLVVLLSDPLRRRAKVFFSKHFFRNRYDYREEWRRLSQALYHADDSRSLGERSIEAAARILNSCSGLILLQKEGQAAPLLPFAVWRRDKPAGISEEPGGSLVKYLELSNWVIDTQQYRESPGFYENLELPEWLGACDNQQIVVPLLLESKLIGLLVLEQDSAVSLTYEDTDLLKIVGRQIAGLLAEQQASDRLAEGRQFQAYSRLSAFLMHDLKNVAAQQSLVVKNAEKHKRNPEFVDDAFATIAHSVKRVNRLIAQLAERDRKQRKRHVNVVEILQAAVERTCDRKPQPAVETHDDTAIVSADRERLFAIFLHVLRNAQDACAKSGKIHACLAVDSGSVKVRITDDGVGMDESFIRERLFRPFESTKGVDGMGIGAYQAREYTRELGGYLDIDSTPGEGTTVSILLPIADEQEGAAQTAELLAGEG